MMYHLGEMNSLKMKFIISIIPRFRELLEQALKGNCLPDEKIPILHFISSVHSSINSVFIFFRELFPLLVVLFIFLFIYSFICSFVPSCIHLLLYLFVYSFTFVLAR